MLSITNHCLNVYPSLNHPPCYAPVIYGFCLDKHPVAPSVVGILVPFFFFFYKYKWKFGMQFKMKTSFKENTLAHSRILAGKNMYV